MDYHEYIVKYDAIRYNKPGEAQIQTEIARVFSPYDYRNSSESEAVWHKVHRMITNRHAQVHHRHIADSSTFWNYYSNVTITHIASYGGRRGEISTGSGNAPSPEKI